MSSAVNCKQSVRLLNNIPKVIGTFTKHQPFKNIVISSRQFSCVKQINPVVTRKEILTANSIFSSQYLHKSFRTSASSYEANKDYYKILGVNPEADHKEIKKAYYQLAKKYHPDTNKGDKKAQKKFQEVSEAYECLSDETKRKQYDAFGSGGGGGDPFGGGFGNAWNFQSSMNAEDLFRTIFGDNASHGFGPSSSGTTYDFGGTQEYQMKLTFLEAAKGVDKELRIKIMDTCESCKGTGSKPGTSPDRCEQCSGTGMETVSTGPFLMRSTCRRCHGKGQFNKHPCSECRGAGQTKQSKRVNVPVPAGIEDGQTVRLGVGDNRQKEIFITFRVESSDYFRRQGSDVHTDANISISQAIFGGNIRVMGIHEDLNVQIPTGSNSHTRLRMNGKGMKKVSGYGYGDHYIHIKIDVPKKLDNKQKAILQAYAEMESDTPGTVKGFTYKKDGSRVVMEDTDGFVADIKEVFDETQDQKPENELDANGAKE